MKRGELQSVRISAAEVKEIVLGHLVETGKLPVTAEIRTGGLKGQLSKDEFRLWPDRRHDPVFLEIEFRETDVGHLESYMPKPATKGPKGKKGGTAPKPEFNQEGA